MFQCHRFRKKSLDLLKVLCGRNVSAIRRLSPIPHPEVRISFSYKCQFTQPFIVTKYRTYCTDATDVKEISIDRRIYQMLEKWDIKNVVSLVITGIESANTSLSGHAITHLLRHLGEIGDVENILILETYLKDSILISIENYYYYLCRALYNSGRMDHGVSYLSKIMSGNYDHESVNILFTLLTVPTMLEFTDLFNTYINIVNNHISQNDFYPVALLWKCYILCGEFSRAEELLSNYGAEVKSFIPVMMNEICQLKDRVETRIVLEDMLRHFLCSPHLRKKKLRILVFKTLLQTLYSDSRWLDLQMTLLDAKDSGVDLPKDVILHQVKALRTVQNHEGMGLDPPLLDELEKWANTNTPNNGQ